MVMESITQSPLGSTCRPARAGVIGETPVAVENLDISEISDPEFSMVLNERLISDLALWVLKR
jgi:hypothetical protein